MPSRLQQEIKQNKPFLSLEHEAVLSIARTAAVLQHAAEQAIKAHGGITLTQYNVLRILRGAGPSGLCRHEIADRLITPVPDVSRLIDRLVRAGYVTRARDAADKRVVATCINAHGMALLTRLDEPMESLTKQKIGHLDQQALAQLIHLLDQVRHPEPQESAAEAAEIPETDFGL